MCPGRDNGGEDGWLPRAGVGTAHGETSPAHPGVPRLKPPGCGASSLANSSRSDLKKNPCHHLDSSKHSRPFAVCFHKLEAIPALNGLQKGSRTRPRGERHWTEPAAGCLHHCPWSSSRQPSGPRGSGSQGQGAAWGGPGLSTPPSGTERATPLAAVGSHLTPFASR